MSDGNVTMSVIDPSTLTIGQTVQFKSISDHDNVVWTGTILGICCYAAVVLTEDVVPYYKEVAKSYPELPQLDGLTFLQLSVSENGEQSRTRYFAREWIDTSTLKIVEDNTSFDIRVYDLDSAQSETILELLRSHGYTVAVV